MYWKGFTPTIKYELYKIKFKIRLTINKINYIIIA